MPDAASDLLRLVLFYNGQIVPVSPRAANPTLTREAGPDGAFYFRDKLSGPMLFSGEDFGLLYAIDNSADRCQPIGLLLQSRATVADAWQTQHAATFTCNECVFDADRCVVEVTPTADDPYRLVLENWDKEINILACPAARTTVTARLAALSEGVRIEFLRTDLTTEPDLLTSDLGWSRFLYSRSWIDNVGRSQDIILFRYRLERYPMVQSNGSTDYTVADLSARGWTPLYESIDSTVTPPVVDYVKAPEISGFKPYLIGSYGDWLREADLLLVDPGVPLPEGYIEVTGPGGAESGVDACGPGLLNFRKKRRESNCKQLFWRFGQFRFSRCFPLLDGLYFLLQQTLPADAQSLLPPTPAQLSQFFSAPTNPATGATQVANEVPRLLLSAASDVKRYGASEPATRLLISPKQFTDDLAALYDVGWFVDPVTGWIRYEHRVYTESTTSNRLDLTAVRGADGSPVTLPARYSYTTDKLPRAEQLSVAAAVTEEAANRLSFVKDEITYSGNCVNSREGQNTSTRSSARLTGDVAGMVLSGGALPDSALVLLAPDISGSLAEANRAVSVTTLLRRYHRHGRVRRTGTLAGVTQPFASTRAGKRQENMAVPLCSLSDLQPDTEITTNLGSGARLEKAVLNIRSGLVTLSVLLPTPEPTTPGPLPAQRAFNDAFNDAAG